jgi:hypothetical protein
MALNQFGAVLSYAIELETHLAAYYEAAGLADQAKVARSNAEALEKSRRQNVTEITLEPIEGLDEAHYAFDAASTSPAQASALILKFYEDVTPKINVLETRQTLKRCQKNHKRLAG